MRILLLGEYSSLFSNLKKGLEKLGHNVKLIADGDGWKNISRDEDLIKPYKTKIGRYINVLMTEFDKRLYQNYDLVLLINFDVFHPVNLHKIITKLNKYNKLVVLCACGYDEALVNSYNNNIFDYYMFDDNVLKRIRRFNGDSKWWNRYRKKYGEIKDIEDYIDLVIPSCYEYKVGYKNTKCKVSKCIPFPIDVDSIVYGENVIEDKIVIFHGLNREIEKGTPIIKDALNIIQEKYGDKVEVVIDGKMPYDKYVKLLKRTNIVVDQCKSYAYGMNACIAMAQGKVVLSGARGETLNEFNISREECPVVPIKPDVKVIVEELSKLIENPQSISFIGEKSRKYIEKYHDAKLVAQQYIDACLSIER